MKELVLQKGYVEWIKLVKSGRFELITVDEFRYGCELFNENRRKMILLGLGIEPDNALDKRFLNCFKVFDFRVKDSVERMKIVKEFDSKIIKLPKTYLGNCFDNIIQLMEYRKEYYVKTVNQARGVGKWVGKKNEFERLVKYILTQDDTKEAKERFIEKFGIDVGNIKEEDEKYRLFDAIKLNPLNVLIQEKVEFDKEFRLLVFYNGDYLVEAREGYEYNSEEERKHYVIDKNEFRRQIGDTKADYIVKESLKFIKFLKLPAISMDFWVSLKNNDIGIFEWSNEFGLDYSVDNLNIISANITDSMERLLYR